MPWARKRDGSVTETQHRPAQTIDNSANHKEKKLDDGRKQIKEGRRKVREKEATEH